MSGFIELRERVYNRGCYMTNELYVSLDDIARVVRCVDDYKLANVITKDGKVHTLNEQYEAVVRKIREAEGGD